MRRLAVLAASARELAPVRAALGFWGYPRRGRLGPFHHQIGHTGSLELHLIETGIGPDRAREASEASLFAFTPDVVISIGYAGALGTADIGEIVLGSKTLDWSKERSKQEIQADTALLKSARIAARDALVTWTQGPVVTVDHVVWRASEKLALGIASGAVAVDMESAAIARVAAEASLPFLLVRAISDRAKDDLPMDFNLWFAPYGFLRCSYQILKRPAILRRLYEMNHHAEQASESLGRFFYALVLVLESQLPPPDVEETLTMGAH